MNSLSWMIYAAEALGNLGTAAALATFLSLLAIAGGVFVGGMIVSIDDRNSTGKELMAASMRKWWLPLCFAFVSVFTPSSNTIYLIAASEAGETIVTSPEAKEVFDDLKTIIKSKLKEQLPKT